ncbi:MULTISPECIES: hypothetical protein [Cyanophyceae]|uniref:hypothetical protein n=1 Tax=Cyanophyceae TaxID=3028117 RepID=UPI001689470E|nr:MULTISPECIES: hypothetical protein [Cyanophyceae]MBD1915512.1 hypothetical protein [Phormidium sp. FACHB-77]MBD2031822.1 hypothetical protein [Phormidium sp. FACHB-322]MBD2050572.1 hypothetical protein [Leptolyngbya sp. FACHB-60]
MVFEAGESKSPKGLGSKTVPRELTRRWWRLLWGVAVAIALPCAPIAQAQEGTTAESDRIIRSNRRVIIRQLPNILRQPSIIILPYPRPEPESEQVRIEFDARGDDWGAVYLNNRLVYRPHNFDRQETLYLPPGGYRLEITGVVRSEIWASGYLDLGRDSSRLVVIRFSKTEGITVSGGPYVWIPD